MTAIANYRLIIAERRLLAVILLTILPWPAVWLGMYRLHSLILTFALYHGVCLLPAAIWGRRLWQRSLRLPNRRELVLLVVATAVVLPIAPAVYREIGHLMLDPRLVLPMLARRGFTPRGLVPLGVYFVIVNAVLEELFWRGVIFNELTAIERTPGLARFGAVWTALTFAGWHYLVVRLLVRPGWAELVVGGIVLAGVLFGRIYRTTSSIILAILWHALVFDLPLIIILAEVVN